MTRLTEKHWRNLDPWECCGQDNYCQRGCHDPGGCANGCIVPRLYTRLARYEDIGLAPDEAAELADQYALVPEEEYAVSKYAKDLVASFDKWLTQKLQNRFKQKRR